MKKLTFMVVVCGMLAACKSATSANLARLSGTVTAVGTNQVRLRTSSVGDIFFVTGSDLSIAIRKVGNGTEPGTAASFLVGDSVDVWWDTNGVILQSLPPVYPVVRAEIVR